MIKNIKIIWKSNDGKTVLLTVELEGISLPGIALKFTLGGGYAVNEPSSRGKDGRYYKNYHLTDDFKTQIFEFYNKNN